MQRHDWMSALKTTRGGTRSALVCRRKTCQVAWWPGRDEPTRPCTGRRA